MSSIINDADSAARWIATALRDSGYSADFSLKSLSEIDRFFDDHTAGGQPKPGGLLAEDLGQRIFALGAYIGEVLRRVSGGSWVGDDSDPRAELNIMLRAPNGLEAWPVQRAIKRLRNGQEDSIAPLRPLVSPTRRRDSCGTRRSAGRRNSGRTTRKETLVEGVVTIDG